MNLAPYQAEGTITFDNFGGERRNEEAEGEGDEEPDAAAQHSSVLQHG